MPLWKAAAKMVGGLFGGSKSTEKAMEMADEAFDTGQEKGERDSKDTSQALTWIPSHETQFDAVVDGISRLQRPGWGVYLFGGCVGWWAFPDVSKISEFWGTLLTIYFTALFGGRALFKDLSKAVAEVMRSKR